MQLNFLGCLRRVQRFSGAMHHMTCPYPVALSHGSIVRAQVLGLEQGQERLMHDLQSHFQVSLPAALLVCTTE